MHFLKDSLVFNVSLLALSSWYATCTEYSLHKYSQVMRELTRRVPHTQWAQIKTRFSVKIKKKKEQGKGVTMALQNELLNPERDERIRKHDLWYHGPITFMSEKGVVR